VFQALTKLTHILLAAILELANQGMTTLNF
jgi:hypothetical protein